MYGTLFNCFSNTRSYFVLQTAAPLCDTGSRAVFFIQDNLERWHDLANTMPADADIVLLDSRANGLQGMADCLAHYRDLDVIHLLSHGSPGQIDMGALTLCSANLQAQAGLLAKVGGALKAGGDWLIYGCEVAQGEAGQTFVDTLAHLAQADVAASRNLTGSARNKGSWLLETQVGVIDASRILQAEQYSGVLATRTENFNNAPAVFDPATNQPYSTWTSGLYKFTATFQGNDYNQVYLQMGVPLDPNGVMPSFGSGGMLKVADIQPNSLLLLTIERVDGSEFSFLSLDVFNNDDNTPATVKGLNGATQVFTDTLAAQSGKTVSSASSITRLEVSGRTDPSWAIGFVVDNFLTVGPDTLPTLTATGFTGSYIENAAMRDLFSRVTASTQDSGQLFTGMTLTVSNVLDGNNELLVVGANEIALVNGSGSINNVGSYSVNVVGQTATITLSNLTRVDAKMNQLIDALGYRNSSENPTAGGRVVTLTSLTDNGATNNVQAFNTSATVTVVPVNDAPAFNATGAALKFNQGGIAVALFSAVTVSTFEPGQAVSSLSLSIAHVANGSLEKLIIDGSEIGLVSGAGVTQGGITYTAVATGPASDSTVTLTLSGGLLGSQPKALVESITYVNASTAPTPGARTVTITSLKDDGGTANGGVDTTSLSISSSVLVIQVVTPSPGTTVDGVVVDNQPVILPGGQTGTQVSVPVITGDRIEQNGLPSVADIPLVTGNGANLLLAQIPSGYGLTASGAGNASVTTGLTTLKAAINGVTSSGADQTHLNGNGQTALNALLGSGNVLVQTLTPIAGSTAPGQPLVINGTASASQHTALVIDASKLPAGSALTLNSVEFAAVVGAVSITGNTPGQLLSGDSASQNFTVTSAGSRVFAGGGNDSLTFSSTTKAATPQTALLQGGSGTDTGSFTDTQSAYSIEQHAGYTLITRKDDPNAVVKLVNVEHLKFADTSIAVQTTTTQSAVATLYQHILGRQADGGGFEFWSTMTGGGTNSLGQTALAMVQSVENATNGFAMNGQSSHDVAVLYKAILGRDPDAAGLAFWTQQKDQGASLAMLADAFVVSTELVGQYKAPADWDFVG